MRQRGLEQGSEPVWKGKLGKKLWTRRSCSLWICLNEGKDGLRKMCEVVVSDRWSRVNG